MDTNNTEIQQYLLRMMIQIDRICQENNIKYTLAYGSVLGAVRHQGFIPWDTDMDIMIPLPDVEIFRNACKNGLPNDMELLEWDKQKKYSPCFDRVVIKDIPHEEFHVDVYPLCGLPDDPAKKERFMTNCYRTYKLFHCKNKNTKFSMKGNVLKIKLLKIPLAIVPNSLIKVIYNRLRLKYDYKKAVEVYNIASPYKCRDYTIKADLFDVVTVPFENIFLPVPRNYHNYLTHIYGDYMTPVRK